MLSRANRRSSSAEAEAFGFQHDEGVRRLAPALVRQPDDGDLDGRVADQDALHLDRRDVLAAADDDVLEAVPDLGVAVGWTTAASPVRTSRRGWRRRWSGSL